MTKSRKILIWVASGAGILLILIGALAIILSRYFGADEIGQNLAAELEVRYHIRSETVKVKFLPSPRMTMSGVRLTLPEKLTASAESVSIHPRIIPMLTGKLVPAGIEIVNPRIAARLPEPAPNPTEKSVYQKLVRLKDRLPQLQAMLPDIIPSMVITIRNGGLELYSGQNRAFNFEEIDLRGSVRAQTIAVELTSGRSDLWQALALSGRMNMCTLEGSAELKLTGGNAVDVVRYANAPAFEHIGKSRVNLSVALSTGGPDSAHADFTASIPQLVLDEPENTPPGSGSLSGTFNADANGMDLVTHFRLDNPRMAFTASYVEKYEGPSVELNVEGRETDVDSVKSLISAVDRDDPAVRKTFEVIRKADIPSILFSSHAKTPAELVNPENFTIRGSIENGVVFAPKPALLVSNVTGDLMIAGGVLEATNLSGQSGNSSTADALMRIGLRGANPLFHMELPLDADLSELPPVLHRVVKSEAFRQELDQIKDVKGKARGRLVLGESLESVDARVETGTFQFSCRYGRLPDPLEVEGSSFLFDGNKVSAASLSGKSGKSSFEKLDLDYDWGEEKTLHVESQGKCVLSMDHLWPYIRTNEFWKTFLEGAPRGQLVFSSFRFLGPIADRTRRSFEANGTVDDVVFQNKQLNGPVTLKTGGFEVTGEEIVMNGISTALADSSLTVSGKIMDYLEQPKKVELQMSGRLGPEGNKIAASLAGLPASIRAISNLNLQSSRLILEKESKATFHGEMLLPAGPEIKLDLVKTPRELSIEKLTINDSNSDAVISVDFGQDQLKIGFSGTLSDKTADRLLIDNKVLKGPMEGKFNAHLYLDSPEKSTAQGKVRVSGFQVPVSLPVPTRIDNAVLEGDGNRIKIQSGQISWDGSSINLAGSIAMAGGAYVVDMNASAESIDLDSFVKSREDLEKDGEQHTAKLDRDVPKKAWDAPVKGTIRLKSQQLSYGKLVWSPANADVVLNPGTIDVRLNQANLCGISTPGTISVTPDGLEIHLTPSAKNQNLDTALACLLDKQHLVSGTYTLTGNISAKGKEGALSESLEGDVSLKAKDGRIFKFNTFAKVIGLLGITEIYRGVLPDIVHEGCAYRSIESKGTIKNGKLVLTDSVVDGPCVKMVFRGEIDLVRQKVDVVALVAPLRTVERVVDAAPIMGKLLNEAFVTVPVRITGDLADPNVVLMSPTAVGEELFGIMKRLVKLPLSIFQPSQNEAATKTDSLQQGN